MDREENLRANQSTQLPEKRSRPSTSQEGEEEVAAASLDEAPIEPCATIEDLLEQQKKLWVSHPVVTWDETFALPTPSLDKCAEIVSDAIYTKRSGRGFISAPRYGKSTAIRYLTTCIRDTYPNIPVLVAEAISSLRPSEADLYADLLEAAGYKVKPAYSVRERRKQLVNLLWTVAKTRGEHRIVIFVDEAQEYGEMHWSWLKSVQNELIRMGVNLILFPFGQFELEHGRSALKASGRDDLVARFLRRLYEFEGVTSEADLAQVMAIFDDFGRYPRPSGWSYTQFFFPRSFEAGWRLSKEARRLWQAICDAKLQKARGGVGMEWIGIMLRHFLLEFSSEDSAGFVGTREIWKECVAASDAAEIDTANE